MSDFSITPRAGQNMVAAAAAAPRYVYRDGQRTDAQDTDHETGLPLWRVGVFVMDEGSSRTPTSISVTVPAATAPAVIPLQPVRFTGLRVRTWSGGASFRADSVAPVADSAPASSFLSDIEEA